MTLSPIVALEIGTSTVRALIGESLEDGHILVTGVGECPSRGVRKGEIIDFDNALACVKTALETAEEQSGIDIQQVHLVVTGGHIESIVSRGHAVVRGADREITHEEVEEAMDMSRSRVNLSNDRAVLHTICQHFFVDNREGVINPLGMEGGMLDVDMLILHGIRSAIRNSVKVLKSTHVDVEDISCGGLCSALAVLTAQQKETGVIVLDFGGGTLDYLVYAAKSIACAGSLAVGGDHITNDIALGLSLPTAQAERLKIESGSAMLGTYSPGQKVSLPAEGGFPGKFVKLEDLHTIINARVDEMLHMAKAEIEKHDLLPLIGAGVILTGGGSHLKQLHELVEQVFEMPCHVGVPRQVSGLAVVTEGPEFAAPIGMIRYGLKTTHKAVSNKFFSRIREMFGH